MKRLLLITFIILTLVIPCQGARLLTSGFEINHNGSGTPMDADGVEFDISYGMTAPTAGATTQTVTKRSGARAYKFFYNNPSVVGTGGWITSLPTMGAGQTYYSRFYILTHTRTTSVGLLNGSNVMAVLFSQPQMINAEGVEVSIDDTDCHLALRNFYGDQQIGASSAALDLDTWYGVEFSYSYDTGYATLKYWKDGYYNSTLTTVVNNGQGPVNIAIASCALGVGLGDTKTGETYMDDWAINDNTGSYQNTWPGEGKVVMLSPASAGDVSNWPYDNGNPGNSNSYTSVDENPPDDNASLIKSKTLNQESLFRFGASGIGVNDTINVVQVGARYLGGGSSANSSFKLELLKASGGTKALSAAITPAIDTTWYSNTPGLASIFQLTAHRDPDGAAWTQATVDTLQAGVICSTAATNYAKLSTLWVMVDYTPATTSRMAGLSPGMLELMLLQ